MSLKQRRILYLFFILIFLTITPLLILYAAGYKLGGGFRLQKTGILILNSKPKGAKIYLNDEIQKNTLKKIYSPQNSLITTPAKIKNLLPGEYKVRVEKEGYWPWEKTLYIHSGQSTFAENINLFKNNLPILLNEGPVNSIKKSPNDEYLFIGGQNLFLDLDNDKTIKATGSPDADRTAWSADSKKILIDHEVITLGKPREALPLRNEIGGSEQISWNTLNGSDTVYYRRGRDINSLNTESRAYANILNRDELGAFLVRGRYLYYTEQGAAETRLRVYDMERREDVSTTNLPPSDYEFINKSNEWINLYDRRLDRLYLVDPFLSLKPIRSTIDDVKLAVWVNDRKMLYSNNYEIWLLDMNNPLLPSKTLLTRVSDSISAIIWHPGNNNIIFSTGKYISIIGLDNREKYNITRIIELDTIKYPVLNKEGDALYFYSRIGQHEGLYKLVIQ